MIFFITLDGYMRPQIVKILTFGLFIINSTYMLGQSPSGSSSPPPPSNNRGPNLPIDDNILILILLGLAFGVYVIYKKSRINTLQ